MLCGKMNSDDVDASVPLLQTDFSGNGTAKARTYAVLGGQGGAPGGSLGGDTMRRTISQVIPEGRSVTATLDSSSVRAKIDWGFDHQGFDLGTIDVIQPSDTLLHNQPPLSPGSVCGRFLGLALASLTVVGLP
jgi:hypothetical protein